MQASRGVLIRDYLIFATKLAIDGAKDTALIFLSSGAVIIDLILGRKEKVLFYTVMRLGERFDLWLNLHGALARSEGILPALESSHAVAEGLRRAAKMKSDQVVIVNLSGRGDKDAAEIARLRNEDF